MPRKPNASKAGAGALQPDQPPAVLHDGRREGELALRPIGFIQSHQQAKFDARHQPSETEAGQHILELLPGCGYEMALQDLAGFSRIWLLWWFHRNAD